MTFRMSASSAGLLLGACACQVIFPVPAMAGWTAGGVPLSIGTGANHDDFQIATNDMVLVPDGADGAIVLWSSGRIVAQHVTADGEIAPGWPANGVDLSQPSIGAVQRFPTAISDGQGGAIVGWWDSNQKNWVQRITGSGTLAWTDSGVVVSNSPVESPAIAPDGSGGAYLAWNTAGSAFQLRATHLDAQGALVASWQPLGTATCSQAVHPAYSSLAADGTGGVIVAWAETRDVPSWSIYSLRLDGSGAVAPGWLTGGVPLCLAPESRNETSSISDGAQGAWVGWQDSRSLVTMTDIYAQHVTANGSLAPGLTTSALPVSRADGDQLKPAMVTDDAGGVLFAWMDSRNGGYDLYANHITDEGLIATGWLADGNAVCTAPLAQRFPVVARDGSGGALIAWGDARNSDVDIYLSRLTGSGSLANGWPVNGEPICTATGDQILPEICESGTGGVILAWRDYRRGDLANGDIYAARVQADGLVAALVSLVEATASDRGANLLWQIAPPAPPLAAVERSEDSSQWTARGDASGDGSGRFRFSDSDVIAGSRYGYRLVFTGSNGERVVGPPTWLSIPTPSPLSLQRISPNPSGGEDLTLRFTISRPGPVRLEWLDLHGRVALTRSMATLEPGEHVYREEAAGRLPAGIYFVRLSQAAHSVIARTVVTR